VSTTSDSQGAPAARPQDLVRTANDTLARLSTGDRAFHEFVCECIDTDCHELVCLSREEYEAARRVPTHFVVLQGHVAPEVERVVEESGRYAVIEKFAEARVVAPGAPQVPVSAVLEPGGFISNITFHPVRPAWKKQPSLS
jgi:hypothetical protein